MYPAFQDNAGPLTPIVFQCERSNNRQLHLLQPQQHRAVRLHPMGYALISHIVNISSLCAFCREVVPTKPFTNTALYYKMMLESEPTPLATKWFGGFYDGSKANVGHYKMTLRNHFVVKTGCNEK